MLDSALPDVHRWLAKKGFVRVTNDTRQYSYDGILPCNQIEVPIRLSFYDLTFQKLPKIYLLEPRPDSLRRPLPHVDYLNELCYLDQVNCRVDPYRPVQTIANLLELAKKTLISSIEGKNIQDVGHEFRSYWKYHEHGVILSDHLSGNIIKYNRLEYKTPTEKEIKQLVVGSDDEISDYSKWRNGILKEKTNRNAILIDINDAMLLPENEPWPPENFKEFYEWLQLIDNGSAKKLYNELGKKSGAQIPLLILLHTKTNIVGVEILLPENLRTAKNNPGRYRKQLLRDEGNEGTSFNRSAFENLSPLFQTTRNLPEKSLSGKRILLIGCGTIGGYLSRLLVQSGAGQGSGELILYDDENLSSGNIGRHYLDSTYLLENKAKACEHKLLTEFPFSKIRAIPKDFIDINDSMRADILIDATGREPFSLYLNDKVVRLKKENKTFPSVLYAWIDGSGYCGRTLYYDGSGGCYRCLQKLSGEERFPPVNNMDDLQPVTYKCGESFIPYPPSASVQTAGLALEATLDWANGNPEYLFRHRRFNKKASKTKSQSLTPIKGCPACQK